MCVRGVREVRVEERHAPDLELVWVGGQTFFAGRDQDGWAKGDVQHCETFVDGGGAPTEDLPCECYAFVGGYLRRVAGAYAVG